MSETKLTAATVVEHYKQGYGQIEGKLHEWEQAKARFLVDVGRECLILVRQSLEPLGELDLTARKNERAKVVKQLEELLPELDGIGVPQLNRWMRWGGICEVIAADAIDIETSPWGLKQAHLIAIEKFFDQHEPTAVYRLKEPWKQAAVEIRALVTLTQENGASAVELESAIDDEAEFPPAPEPKAASGPSASTNATASPSPNSGKPSTQSAAPAKPPASPSKPAPAAPTKVTPDTKPAPSPVPSAASKSTGSPPSQSTVSSKDLADQAFKLMQQPEILAGVFRREWPPELVLAIVENLIKAMGENSKNLIGLAKAYHRMKPVVLTHFDEYAEDGKFKLAKKQNPEPPTLEQLAPCGELATA